MKHLKLLAGLTALALLAGLAGCGGAKEIDDPADTKGTEAGESIAEESVSAESGSDEPSSAEEVKKGPAEFKARYADEVNDVFLRSREFTADSSEYAVRILFSTDRPVRDFKLYNLELDPDSEEVAFKAAEFYTLEEMVPDESVIIIMTFAGDIPNYGVSYVDTDGTEKIFSVSQSGEDGSIVLDEIKTTSFDRTKG